MDSIRHDTRPDMHQLEAPVAPYDEVLAFVQNCLGDMLAIAPSDASPTTTLLELGAESFDFVHLVFRLERAYHIEIARIFTVPDRHTVDDYVRVAIAAFEASHEA